MAEASAAEAEEAAEVEVAEAEEVARLQVPARPLVQAQLLRPVPPRELAQAEGGLA